MASGVYRDDQGCFWFLMRCSHINNAPAEKVGRSYQLTVVDRVVLIQVTRAPQSSPWPLNSLISLGPFV